MDEIRAEGGDEKEKEKGGVDAEEEEVMEVLNKEMEALSVRRVEDGRAQVRSRSTGANVNGAGGEAGDGAGKRPESDPATPGGGKGLVAGVLC